MGTSEFDLLGFGYVKSIHICLLECTELDFVPVASNYLFISTTSTFFLKKNFFNLSQSLKGQEFNNNFNSMRLDFQSAALQILKSAFLK